MSERVRSAGADGDPLSQLFFALFYTGFAALSGALTQLTLSPVYGSIPAATQHEQILRWALLLAFLARDTIQQYLPPNPKRYLPVLAMYVPMAQYFLLKDSTRLGPSTGPVATELLTYFPVVPVSYTHLTLPTKRIV